MPRLIEDQVIVDIGPVRFTVSRISPEDMVWRVDFQMSKDEWVSVIHGDDEYGQAYEMLRFINNLEKACGRSPGVCSTPDAVMTEPVK